MYVYIIMHVYVHMCVCVYICMCVCICCACVHVCVGVLAGSVCQSQCHHYTHTHTHTWYQLNMGSQSKFTALANTVKWNSRALLLWQQWQHLVPLVKVEVMSVCFFYGLPKTFLSHLLATNQEVFHFRCLPTVERTCEGFSGGILRDHYSDIIWYIYIYI